jgi:hypothetical protein
LPPRAGSWQIPLVAPFDWSRVRFTEHMTEAAAVVAECRVVLDFARGEPVTYEVKVFDDLKRTGDTRYFAVGASDDAAAGGYRPVGAGETPEEALQECLNRAGVHLRRLVKQGDDE